jgi:hypothetical protein
MALATDRQGPVTKQAFAVAHKKQTVTTLILLEKLYAEKREETALILSQESGRNLRHIRKAFHPKGPVGGWCGTRNDDLIRHCEFRTGLRPGPAKSTW